MESPSQLNPSLPRAAVERSHPARPYVWPYCPAHLRIYGCASMGLYAYGWSYVRRSAHLEADAGMRRYMSMDGDGSLWRRACARIYLSNTCGELCVHARMTSNTYYSIYNIQSNTIICII